MRTFFKGILLTLLFLIAFIACKDTKQGVEEQTNTEAPKQEVVEKQEETVIQKVILPQEEKNSFELIIPAYYDEDIGKDIYEAINDSWLEFREVNGKYIVQKADYNLSEPLLNECTGMMQIGVFSPDEEEPLMYFSPSNKSIQVGDVPTLDKGTLPLWTENTIEFVYNNDTYIFTSTGKLIETYEYTSDDSSEPKTFKNYSNYKLYLTINDKDQQEILSIDGFNDTFVELLFVGDLDGDGKLDFIFDTSTHYEEKSISVYLSKGAKNYVYLAANGRNDFSC